MRRFNISRIDTHGNRFLVRQALSEANAAALVNEFNRKVEGNKQMFFLEEIRRPKKIGSFASSDLETLLEAAIKGQATPSPSMSPTPPVTDPIDSIDDCGKRARHLVNLSFNNGVTFLNHGAFGAPLHVAQRSAEQWRQIIERNPVQFFDREYFGHVLQRLVSASRFALDQDEVEASTAHRFLLTNNATEALNSVIFSLPNLSHIAVFKSGYASVRRMVEQRPAAELLVFNDLVSQECTEDDDTLLHHFTQFLNTTPHNLDLLVIDAICSHTSRVMPVRRLATAAKASGRVGRLLLDAAHVVGSPLSLRKYFLCNEIDYVAGSFHKWTMSCRGCGFLYVASNEAVAADDFALLSPAVVSHGFTRNSSLLDRFLWQGARDYAPWLALDSVFDFWSSHQRRETFNRYAMQLLGEATKLLVDAWQTDALYPSPRTTMNLIRLPIGIDDDSDGGDEKSRAQRVQDHLHATHRIEVPVKRIGDSLYVRISTAFYNDLEQYQRLAKAFC